MREVTEYVEGVLGGDRVTLGRAITLVESTRADHREQAQHLLTALLPHTGAAKRIGISGVPGAGKSTFIDTLGMNLIADGRRVAVLAVDPSSSRSGGSILADKTRMTRLATNPSAFVRPSPAAGTLGGVARSTRETLLLMEAAGHDIVLIETVGVGQSEYVVADMVDTFLFLTLARTGDSLQAMKRGVLELADVVAVNKADEKHEDEARRAAMQLSGALRLLGAGDGWQAPVVTCSGLHNIGLDMVWQHIEQHEVWLERNGDLDAKRRRQHVEWSRALVRANLLGRLAAPQVHQVVATAEEAVLAGEITADQAALRIIAAIDAH